MDETTPDAEIGCMRLFVDRLGALPDDDSRRRVIAYCQARCIKPIAVYSGPTALAQAQMYGQQNGPTLK